MSAGGAGRERVPPGQSVTQGWPVLHFGTVPPIDLEAFRLRVHGAVERELELSWEELRGLPRVERTSDFHCVTKWSRLDNRWEGVALRTLAAEAGLDAAARFVRFSDGRDYDTSVPLALLDEVLLADTHDGAPLAAEHGGPLRAVVPSRYAWKSCKWVREVEFLSEDRLGFWEVRGYHPDGDPWREQRLV